MKAVFFPWRGRHEEAGLAAGCDVRCSRFASDSDGLHPLWQKQDLFIHHSQRGRLARPLFFSMMTKCECVFMPIRVVK